MEVCRESSTTICVALQTEYALYGMQRAVGCMIESDGLGEGAVNELALPRCRCLVPSYAQWLSLTIIKDNSPSSETF